MHVRDFCPEGVVEMRMLSNVVSTLKLSQPVDTIQQEPAPQYDERPGTIRESTAGA